MKRVCLVGHEGHGKTTLIEELASEFTRRGLKVGSIKHSSHEHELDKPGKDSYRHRTAGANPAGIITTSLTAVFLPRQEGADPFVALEPLYGECDIVLVEGSKTGDGIKVEVFRESVGEEPLGEKSPDIRAIITDDDPDVNVPIWPRAELDTLADRILGLVSE